MATHPIPLAHEDQDVRTQWTKGALRGLSGDEVYEARRRQLRGNIQILDVLGQFCQNTDQGPLPRGWYSITRGLHSRDIYERIGNLPRGALACLIPSHDDHGQQVLTLQVTYPREALLPAVDFITPADEMELRDRPWFEPHNRQPTFASGSYLAYMPPVPEGQENARFPYRAVQVSTLTNNYKWVIARTHRLSPMLFTLAMSEVLKVSVSQISITLVKRPRTTGTACPYELFCVVRDRLEAPGHTRPFGMEDLLVCPICGSTQPLDRPHMDQDSHRFGMVMLMDGMALVEHEGQDYSRMQFTTFERVHESQLGDIRLHQAAATHTDANVNTNKGCLNHLRRLQGIYNALANMHTDDANDLAKTRAKIKLMYFALLRLLDETKVRTTVLLEQWKEAQLRGIGVEQWQEETQREGREYPTPPRVEDYVLRYTHRAMVIFLRMAVLRQQQIIRMMTLEQERDRVRFAGNIAEDITQLEDLTGTSAEDWRPIGGRFLPRHGALSHIMTPDLAEVAAELMNMRARYGTPHPLRVATGDTPSVRYVVPAGVLAEADNDDGP